MFYEEQILKNKEQTIAAMFQYCRDFAADLAELGLDKLGLYDFFDFVRAIPYRLDREGREVLARPRHIVKFKSLGMDCKKKSILCGCYFLINNYQWRFCVSSTRPDGEYHHIFPQVFLNDRWLNFDATYKHFYPFQSKKLTAAKIFYP